MLLVLVLMGGYILYQYFKALRNFQSPYKEHNKFEILGSVLISPILSVIGGIAILILSPILANIMEPIFSWDLPVDFLVILPVVIFFFMIECIYLLISNRFWDISWHVVMMVFGILIYHGWNLLLRLELYLR